MKLEDQKVSLEYAKKLKELGVKQESLFYWIGYDFTDQNNWVQYGMPFTVPEPHMYISAFTIAELIEMFPVSIWHDDLEYFLIIQMNQWSDGKKYFMSNYQSISDELFYDVSFDSENMADSLAKMLIHLIENELMEIK